VTFEDIDGIDICELENVISGSVPVSSFLIAGSSPARVRARPPPPPMHEQMAWSKSKFIFLTASTSTAKGCNSNGFSFPLCNSLRQGGSNIFNL